MIEVRPLHEKPGEHTNAPEIDPQPPHSDPPHPDPKQSRADARPDDDGGEKPEPQPKQSKLPLIILAVVIVLGVIGGSIYWWMTRNQESSDDAYTDGHAISISPQVSGIALRLAVTDNQFVHGGELLVQIDPRDYQAARDQAAGALEVAQAQLANAQEVYAKAQIQFPAQLQAAEAQVDSAQAGLTNAQSDNRRQQTIARGATTQQAVDQATATLGQAAAQLQQNNAQLLQARLVPQDIAQAAAQVKQWRGQVQQTQGQLDRAELDLSYTRVLAPGDGWVTERRVEQGNYLQAGGAILALVSPQVWITANFKETQLDRIRPGAPVTISVDAYPELKLAGHVDSVQMGSGSRFTAFPAENATGNYIKIVQRVPVKIDIDSGLDPQRRLPLGLSVTPTVTVK